MTSVQMNCDKKDAADNLVYEWSTLHSCKICATSENQMELDYSEEYDCIMCLACSARVESMRFNIEEDPESEKEKEKESEIFNCAYCETPLKDDELGYMCHKCLYE
jgi:hypothetical protein